MKKDELMKLGLDEEMAKKIEAFSLEELKNYFEKSKYDEIKAENKNLVDLVKERDKQLDELKKIDPTILKKTIEDLQVANKNLNDSHLAEIRKLKVNNAVEKALLTAGAKNIKAAKALLVDYLGTEPDFDGDNLKGLDDEINNLRCGEDTKFLFEMKDDKASFVGVKPIDGSDNITLKNNQNLSLAEAIGLALNNK